MVRRLDGGEQSESQKFVAEQAVTALALIETINQSLRATNSLAKSGKKVVSRARSRPAVAWNPAMPTTEFRQADGCLNWRQYTECTQCHMGQRMFNFGKYDRRVKCLFAAGAMALLCAPGFANEIQVNYNLAAGATSAAISVPAFNTPVSVTCSQNQVGFRGIGQVTMLRTSVAPQFLEWVGMDIATTAITSGFSSTKGTHIIYCDFTGKTVDMQVNSAGFIQIVNTSPSTASGVINFVW